MRRIYSFLFLFLAVALTAQADVTEYDGLQLKFYRTGTDASSVSVDVLDQNGEPISGASATLTSNYDFKATTNAVTDSILCFNVNGSTSPTITMTVEITGLPSTMAMRTAGLDIHALNSSGSYQQNYDAKSREFDVTLSQGTSTDDLAQFVSWDDIDIASGIGTTGNVHQVWATDAASTVSVGSTLVLQLTVTKGATNNGCFFGLSSISLYKQTTGVKMKFYRTGITAAKVNLILLDQYGEAISGASGSMTTSHAFKTTTNAVTDSILCPNVNGNTSRTVVLTFTLTGLPKGLNFNSLGLDIHALNSSGSYQQSSDSQVRQYNVALSQGTSADSLTEFAGWTDIDIAADVSTGGTTHQVWLANSPETCTTADTLVLQLTITKGTTNSGCYFGLSSLELSNQTISADGTYFIRLASNPGYYMTEEADGSLSVAAQDNVQRQFWQFVPTDNDSCYYLYNAASGHYIQSCNILSGSSSVITTGADPVEYYVSQVATSGSAVRGFYRFTSTDCDDYNDTSAGPLGLSKNSSTTSVEAGSASESDVNSYWVIEATDNSYILAPFTFTDSVGNHNYVYEVCNAEGQALDLTADTLSWQTRNISANQNWYFVGENNSDGFYIVNAANDSVLGDPTLYRVIEYNALESTYIFRPLSTFNEAGTALSVANDSVVSFREARSPYARAIQAYTLPCGSLGSTYIAHATIDGEGALETMEYPLSTLSGSTVTAGTASTPSSWYTIYTDDKATLLAGATADLTLTLSASPASGEALYAYYDWDRDGVFEAMQELTIGTSVEQSIEVPAEAETGKSRIRLRLTSNGLTDAEDDVTGQILDFVINVTDEADTNPTVTVAVNDSTRGTAAVTAANGEATVTATTAGDATFVCWSEGNNVLSAEATYSFSYTRSMALTAYFSPNYELTGINTVDLTTESAIVDITGDNHTVTVETDGKVKLVQVFTTEGRLVASSTSKQVRSNALDPATYVVKVYLENDGSVSRPILVK